ncbi:MAG: Ig-like domain-containing protein [bacterium]
MFHLNLNKFIVVSASCLVVLAGCSGGGGDRNANLNIGNNIGNNPAANLDTTPPSVVTTDPTSGQSLTAPISSIRVEFSEAMDPDSVKSAFQLEQLKISGVPSLGGINPGAPNIEANFVAVPLANAVATNDNQNFEFPIAAPVTAGIFRISLNKAAKDVGGNALAEEFKSNFKILPPDQGAAANPDGAPIVESINPSDGADDVARQTIINLTFSQPMSVATVQTNFSLVKFKTDRDGNVTKEEEVIGTLTACPDKKSFNFNPAGALLDRTEKYKIRIAKGAKSAAGVPLAQDFTSTFETKFTFVGGVGTEVCP